MKIPPRLLRRTDSGYALVVVMITMALLLVVYASLVYWSSSNAKITVRNNLFNQSEAAAESATENIIANMMRDFTFQSLNSPAYYQSLFPPTNGWPVYYQFSDTNGVVTSAASVSIGSQAWTNLNSQYAGLYGLANNCQIASTAAPQGTGNTLSATVYQSVQFAFIPLFQFAVFYNMDLEISPGGNMTLNGAVWSNGNIWQSPSATLTYNSSVSSVGQIYNYRSPNDPQASASNPNIVYQITQNNPLSGESTLTMPVGGSTNNSTTNVLGIIQPPPTAYAPPNFTAAYATNGMTYLENAADLIISNSAAGLLGTRGTNITVFYQNPNNSPNYITAVPPDVLISSNVVSGQTNLVYTYSFVTNAAFYDYRESDTVQAVQVDVAKFNAWLANTNTRGGYQYNYQNTNGSTSKGHGINSAYVNNMVPFNAAQLPAVRMINGAQLPPAGLTVVTAQPIYVQGDYNVITNNAGSSSRITTNTAYTYPAALMGDAITILSGSWSDSWNSSTSLGSRNVVSNDTVNAAMLMGIVQSVTVNGNKQFSGGLENYLRLLEDWSGNTLQYNGSIVAMYTSQYATNFWQNPGNYYQVPTRNWGFDANFMNYAKLPPLTPQVRGIIRGNWAAW